MGGAVIMLAMLARQRRERERRMAQARRRREEEDRRLRLKKEDERRTYSSTNYGGNKTYTDCVRYEIERDEELRKFFDDLDSTIERVRNGHVRQYTERAVELDKVLKKYGSQMEEIKKKLEESGVEVKTKRTLAYILSRIGYIESNEPTDYEVPVTFNGIRLTKEMLENPDDKTYQNRYDDLEKQTEEKEKEKAQLEKELRRLERRERIPFTNKYEINNKKRQVKLKLEENEEYFQRKEQARKELEIFNSFTPDQRKTITDYLGAERALQDGLKAMRECARYFESEKPDKDSKEIMEEALVEMGKNGYSEEDLNKIFLKLDRVAIKRYRGEYYREPSMWSPRYKGSLEGFIAHVYDTDETFVERNADQIREGIDG
jgi:hypothetical protein